MLFLFRRRYSYSSSPVFLCRFVCLDIDALGQGRGRSHPASRSTFLFREENEGFSTLHGCGHSGAHVQLWLLFFYFLLLSLPLLQHLPFNLSDYLGGNTLRCFAAIYAPKCSGGRTILGPPSCPTTPDLIIIHLLHTHVHTHACMHAYAYTRTCMYTYVYISLYTVMYTEHT